MREADKAFGTAGPPPTLAGRQAASSDDVIQRLKDLSPKFWACGDEIFTRVFLYAREHPADFEGLPGR
jgi:hypothetical protein